jgi:hypothetical protein
MSLRLMMIPACPSWLAKYIVLTGSSGPEGKSVFIAGPAQALRIVQMTATRKRFSVPMV